MSRKGMKVGDLIAVKSKNSPHYDYGKIKNFHPIKGGGEGFTCKGLTRGLHQFGFPIAWIEDIVFFNSLDEAQEHINRK